MWHLEEDENILGWFRDIHKAPWKIEGKLQVRFEEMNKVYVLYWIFPPLDLEIENADIESHLEDELDNMCVDIIVQK